MSEEFGADGDSSLSQMASGFLKGSDRPAHSLKAFLAYIENTLDRPIYDNLVVPMNELKIESNDENVSADTERPVPGQMVKQEEKEVKNNAGGFVFPVSDECRVRRFLILGSAGGGFYVGEKELTMDNIDALIKIINKGKAAMILREIVEISLAGRNAKQPPVMFALALCARYRVGDVKNLLSKHNVTQEEKNYAQYIGGMHKVAFDAMHLVCRIPTHLFMFVDYCELVAKSTSRHSTGKSTGWGRMMRAAVSNWYLTKRPEQLAMHMTKYQKRAGWSHRDLLRLAHPKMTADQVMAPELLEYKQLFHYACKGELETRKRRLPAAEAGDVKEKFSEAQLDKEDGSKALDMVEAFLSLKNEKDKDVVVHKVKKFGLVREHIPTELLGEADVWRALCLKMPMTALIRNLGKISSLNLFEDNEVLGIVMRQLNDETQLKTARVHPLTVLLAKAVYEQGHGDKGSLTWKVKTEVDEALETAFYKCFANCEPTGKRYCLALDVSGSMGCPVSNSMLSCYSAESALALIHLRNEESVECVAFSHELTEVHIDKTSTIDQVRTIMQDIPMGSTDCAQPMLWAAQKEKKFDVFIVYTDCETWAGQVHPAEALRRYRKASGILDAKLIVMGMTASEFTLADPDDAAMLDIAGLDSSVPSLVADFVNGKI